tara:strand:+ start:291 stop:515 length:225 start_codon:yes stop_codon:yes gene_type:complete
MGNQETVSLPTKENIPAMASSMKMHREEVGFTRGKGGMFSSFFLSDSHKSESSVLNSWREKCLGYPSIARIDIK